MLAFIDEHSKLIQIKCKTVFVVEQNRKNNDFDFTSYQLQQKQQFIFILKIFIKHKSGELVEDGCVHFSSL